MDGVIYRFRNKLNNKSYIGQSIQLYTRYNAHIRRSGYLDSRFYRAVRKYGWENFEFSILEDDVRTKELLDELEIYYIKLYDSFNNGYNATLGGDGSKGTTHTMSEEGKLSVANANREHPNFKGKHHLTETKVLFAQTKNGGSIIIQKDKDGNIINQFSTLQEAADYLGLKSKTAIQNNIMGRSKLCKGYKFEYVK